MISYLYVVHDKAANSFTKPIAVPTERDAIAGFKAVAAQPDHNFNKFPADFTLFEIGQYNESNGELRTYSEKKLIINAASFIKDL